MMLLTFLIPALIILAVIYFNSKNNKKLRAIKVPVDKRNY